MKVVIVQCYAHVCIMSQLLFSWSVSGQVITAHPQPQLDLLPGSTATFSVTVEGASQTAVYFWSRSGVSLNDDGSGKYEGLGTNSLNVVDVQEADEGVYSVFVFDGSLMFSNPAQLSICEHYIHCIVNSLLVISEQV